MKFTRRITTAFVCLMLCVLCAFSAFAEGNTYTIDPVGMTIELPSSMSVTTKSSGSLSENTYLEAKIPETDFSITITMITDESTQSIGELSNLSSASLSDFKERLEDAEASENSLTEEIRSATYNENLYIDFSQKQYLENDVISYIRQSMTIKGGTGIYITSVSVGDDFTSEELSIIRNCLESVSFDAVKGAKKTSPWTVILWILVIILLLAMGFFGFVFYMRYKSKKRRKALSDKSLSRGDYRAPRKTSKSGTVGGFKTSSDYFLRGYDTPDESIKEIKPSRASGNSHPQKAKNKESALKRTGYFFKNLSREIQKSKKAKTSKNQPRPKSKDYDVFSDR